MLSAPLLRAENPPPTPPDLVRMISTTSPQSRGPPRASGDASAARVRPRTLPHQPLRDRLRPRPACQDHNPAPTSVPCRGRGKRRAQRPRHHRQSGHQREARAGRAPATVRCLRRMRGSGVVEKRTGEQNPTLPTKCQAPERVGTAKSGKPPRQGVGGRRAPSATMSRTSLRRASPCIPTDSDTRDYEQLEPIFAATRPCLRGALARAMRTSAGGEHPPQANALPVGRCASLRLVHRATFGASPSTRAP